MVKQAPTLPRIATMVVFALSCFGLLLFLWVAFGGATPLRPQGYRFSILLPEANGLASQADVRISGVPVGKVVGLKRVGATTDATIQMNSQYAPIPVDTRAVLRQKTLLGETYVELSAGSKTAPKLPENGTLGTAQVQSTVELDQILRTFDPVTRRDLQVWMQSMSAALAGRGPDVNNVLGNLSQTSQSATNVLSILNAENGAVRTLIHDSGVVFGTIGSRQAAVADLINSGERVFATTAARNLALEATVRALPPFLATLKPALVQAQATAIALDPSVRVLEPVAPQIRSLLTDVGELSPQLRSAFQGLEPVISASGSALPALTDVLNRAQPLFDQLDPFTRNLVPIAMFLDLYRQPLITSWAKIAAATQATFPDPATGKPTHYLRALPPIESDLLATQTSRPGNNRHNPYPGPSFLSTFASGLESLDCANAGNPPFPVGLLAAAPPCRVQPPISFEGVTSSFPHLVPAG